MGLIYDDPRLAALALTRIAAEESAGPGELAGRMHAVLDDLVQRNGAEYLKELVIVLDELARVTGNSTAELLDAVELEALEDIDEGG